ncbi:MAG: transposase [candidate division WOR-3 bacterium]
MALSQALNYDILINWISGLDIDELTPDDNTLVKFRRRLGDSA